MSDHNGYMDEAVSESPKLTGSRYSLAGILITFLLCITFLVLTQFLVDDVREAFLGKQPEFSEKVQSVNTPISEQSQRSSYYSYKGKSYEDYNEVNQIFNKEEKLPHQINAILIKIIIFIPLFFLSVYMVFGLKIGASAYRLTTSAFFIAMSIDMINVLTDLGQVLYAYNQRLAIYAIGGTLIIVFVATIVYIQNKSAPHHSSPEQSKI